MPSNVRADREFSWSLVFDAEEGFLPASFEGDALATDAVGAAQTAAEDARPTAAATKRANEALVTALMPLETRAFSD